MTRWRVPGSVEEVSEALGDPLDLPRWWPDVYLDVWQVEAGGEDGIGRVFGLHTKGWLPYRLRWQLRVTENRSPHGFTLEAWGDFVGKGVWTFAQDGEEVDVTYEWTVRADKPLLKRLSFLLRPVFEANHRWAMARGEESLRRELARRREARLAATGSPGVRG